MESSTISLEAIPASGVNKRGRNGATKGKAGGGERSHKLGRERKDKMNNMFSDLNNLLPHVRAQTDKATILEEAVSYIKNLEATLERLKKQKMERIRGKQLQLSTGETQEKLLASYSETSAEKSPSTMKVVPIPNRVTPYLQCWSSPNAVLNISGEDSHISICTDKKPGLFSKICSVLEKYKLEVVTADVSTDHFRSMYLIHARATCASDPFPQMSMIEEIFNLVVSQTLLYISS